MIFVSLGTQDKSFIRLLKKIDELLEKGIIKDKVVVQSGHTKYESTRMQIFHFIPMNQFNEYIESCDFMITHAGVGTIINGINHKKKVVAVARRVKYGEHENDHQTEIVSKFAKSKHILGCMEVEELEEKLAQLDVFEAKPYESNNGNFCALIDSLINDLDKK